VSLARHAGFWLALAASLIMLLALLEDTSNIQRDLQTEAASAVSWLSKETVVVASERANRWFTATFERTGIKVRAESERDRPDRVLSRAPSQWWLNIMLITYRLFLRLSLFLGVLAPISVLMVAALVDGLVLRRIKTYEFGASSPLSYNLASHVLVATPVLPLAYFASPLPMNIGLIFSGTILSVVCLNRAAANFVQTT